MQVMIRFDLIRSFHCHVTELPRGNNAIIIDKHINNSILHYRGCDVSYNLQHAQTHLHNKVEMICGCRNLVSDSDNIVNDVDLELTGITVASLIGFKISHTSSFRFELCSCVSLNPTYACFF